jgi:flagellar motor switch protein FliG
MSDNEKTKDEAINGAAIVAKILNQMPAEHKARLLQAIEKQNPEIATKITQNLTSIDDIAELTEQSVQSFIKNINAKDLSLTLSKANDKVRETVLANLSERRRVMLLEEMAQVDKSSPVDVEQAQRRVLKTLEEMKNTGSVRDKAKHERWV